MMRFGYVSKSGITIKTQFAQAQKVDNEFVSQELENFMIDINYSRNVYEQAMAEGTGEGYYRAYAAIVYGQQSFLVTTASLQQILD